MVLTGSRLVALAALTAALSLAGSGGAAEAAGDARDRAWEKRNRERARAGLLPRKPPPGPAKAGTAAARPTRLPEATAAATAIATPTTTPAPAAAPTWSSPPSAPELPRHAPGLLSRRWLPSGEQLHRVVDARGRISERRVDARGFVVEARVVGDAAALPLVSQTRQPDGGILQVTRDVSGALVALVRDGGGHLLGARVLPAAEASQL